MGLPQDNPEGYRKSAPRFAAAQTCTASCC